MRIKDIVPLHQIYYKLKTLEKEHNWGFDFVVDDGDYETAIIFNEENPVYRRPKHSESWEDIVYPEVMKVPDILDLEHKIIVEYEEETGNRRTGAYLAKKGHGKQGDLPNKRDSQRNDFYKYCKFRLCRIWQSDLDKECNLEVLGEGKLFNFLADCYCNRSTVCYKV